MHGSPLSAHLTQQTIQILRLARDSPTVGMSVGVASLKPTSRYKSGFDECIGDLA